MSERGDKSGEFSMSERSEERGRDDGCGEWSRGRSLGQEVRDEGLVCLEWERRRWLVEVSEEDSVLPRRDGGHRWGKHSHRGAYQGQSRGAGGQGQDREQSA
jgi:hypothetical protein